MGRGRQKAKDAKIARQLKYTPHGTDLRELERELLGGEANPRPAQPETDEDDDPYARWIDEEDEDN
ncbi:MAG: DUF3073 domain-containing protein [Demequina sp.]